MKKRQSSAIPSIEELEAELKRSKEQNSYGSSFRSIVGTLIILIALAFLISVLAFPVVRIKGSSMTPGLYDGNVVVCLKNASFEVGDNIAFSYENRTLVRRVIARSGDRVNIDENGYVYVNKKKQNEPYVQEHTMGRCDLTFPYEVPAGTVFVMGDNRRVSVDSRSSSLGCIPEDQIIGRVLLRVWPLNQPGPVNQ